MPEDFSITWNRRGCSLSQYIIWPKDIPCSIKILISIFFFFIIIIFIIFMLNLKHMIYEGFPQVPDHPRLLSEYQVVLGHEETVEAEIVLGRFFFVTVRNFCEVIFFVRQVLLTFYL